MQSESLCGTVLWKPNQGFSLSLVYPDVRPHTDGARCLANEQISNILFKKHMIRTRACSERCVEAVCKFSFFLMTTISKYINQHKYVSGQEKKRPNVLALELSFQAGVGVFS